MNQKPLRETFIYDLDKDVQELDNLIKDSMSITHLTKEDFLNTKNNNKNKASYFLKQNLEGLIDMNNFYMVVPTGLEPVTQGSSGLCSTN